MFFVLGVAGAFAQYFEFKDYYDYDNGNSGYAGAMYVTSLQETDIDIIDDYVKTFIPESANKISKISKKTKWLINQALGEWDYAKDEVYFVVCADSEYSTSCTFFVVTIVSKDEYIWKGYSLSEEDVEVMMN